MPLAVIETISFSGCGAVRVDAATRAYRESSEPAAHRTVIALSWLVGSGGWPCQWRGVLT